MKNKYKFIGVFIIVGLIIFIGINIVCGNNLKDIRNQVDKYVDMTSISSDYKVHNATDGDDIRQITFINTKTRQRMSITFSKYLDAKDKDEMSKFVEYLKDQYETEDHDKITSFKTFEANGQTIPYFNLDQYYDGELGSKAMIGGIPNCNGRFVIIQSYSSPERYDEQEAIKFFSKIKLKD